MDFFPNYYHIFNRGVEKRNIFGDYFDFKRFIVGMKEFNDSSSVRLRERLEVSPGPTWVSTQVGPGETPGENLGEEKLVEIVVYCLNSNHYHLLLKETSKNGVARFIQKLITGYTGYFNKKYERTGALFQGKHKKVKITSNAQLLYLSAYINANHYVHKIKEFEDWEFSSLSDYVGKRRGTLCSKKDVLEQFEGNEKDYEKFCKKTCDDIKERRVFAKYLLE